MLHVTLKTEALKKLQLLMDEQMRPTEVVAGFQEGGVYYPTGPQLHDGKTIQDVAAYAYQNEYGDEDIPARPFMNRAAMVHGQQWKEAVGKWLSVGADAETALQNTGEQMCSDIRGSILGEDGAWPENSEKTKREKTRTSMEDGKVLGSTTPQPLIDTGDMLRSISYKVQPLSTGDESE